MIDFEKYMIATEASFSHKSDWRTPEASVVLKKLLDKANKIVKKFPKCITFPLRPEITVLKESPRVTSYNSSTKLSEEIDKHLEQQFSKLYDTPEFQNWLKLILKEIPTEESRGKYSADAFNMRDFNRNVFCSKIVTECDPDQDTFVNFQNMCQDVWGTLNYDFDEILEVVIKKSFGEKYYIRNIAGDCPVYVILKK